MNTATVTIRGLSPYAQSKHYAQTGNDDEALDKGNNERSDDYEKRSWRRRMHTNPKGEMVIPAMAFKNCLDEAAGFLGMKIPGRGQARYGKRFAVGVMVFEDATLGVKAEDVRPFEHFVPSDGKPGGGSRVTKFFPHVVEWEATATFHILDDFITEDVFRQHIEAAGMFIGLGAFRPIRKGPFGRFEVIKIKWSKAQKGAA